MDQGKEKCPRGKVLFKAVYCLTDFILVVDFGASEDLDDVRSCLFT